MSQLVTAPGDAPAPPAEHDNARTQGSGSSSTAEGVARMDRSGAVISAGHGGDGRMQWTVLMVAASVALFCIAGVAEIGGGWLVWQAIRKGRPWWWAMCGAAVLVTYGFIATLQPTDNFGRIFAVYGGFFIALSYLWGWALDGIQPDTGDWIGTGVALVGVCIAMFWRR